MRVVRIVVARLLKVVGINAALRKKWTQALALVGVVILTLVAFHALCITVRTDPVKVDCVKVNPVKVDSVKVDPVKVAGYGLKPYPMKDGYIQPHIVFVLADDYGHRDVGYHGSRIRTPNLDRLAAEGVRLENYYVQHVCTPTRSQLISGRYQIHTGLQHKIIWAAQPNALPTDSPTIADKLQEAGYATHLVGKWHLGFHKKEFLPNNRGFHSFYGFLTGSENHYTHERCYKGMCGLDLYNNTEPVFTERDHYSTHLFTERAVDIIRRHPGSTSKPLFLYLSYAAVHAPLLVPERYIDEYQYIKDENRRNYAGMTTCMDEGIGNVTEALKEAGMWDNTVLIFSSDNGGQPLDSGNNWPLKGHKGTLWEGGLRAVGFVHSPRFIKRGSISKELFHVTDWYPTLVEGAARWFTNGSQLDGYNQWRSLTRQEPGRRTELLHDIDTLYAHKGDNIYPGLWDTRVRAAIRVGDMKLITGQAGEYRWVPPPEEVQEIGLNGSSFWGKPIFEAPSNQNLWLFNVTADPEERHDLSQTHQDVVQRLLSKLAAYNSTAVPPRYPPDDPESDPAKHGGVWGPWQ